MLHYFILRELLTEIQHVNKNLRGLYYSIYSLHDSSF